METYQVKKLGEHPQIHVEVPGSKSMTNRALLMAALAEGESNLSGVLFSEDSLVFLQALRNMGFYVKENGFNNEVLIRGRGGVIPKKQADIYTGSAGTAARFLTAMAGMSDGVYCLNASAQMKKRPMKELLDALAQLGVNVQCLEEKDTFPLCVGGITRSRKNARISLNIDRSSQFLSAMLMTAPVRFENMEIVLTGKRNARSYVEMTEYMMKQFGHPGVIHISDDCYRVIGAAYHCRDYEIEPDVSAACYFYAMAAVTGGEACVERMRQDSLQGDIRFLDVLEQMGCTREWRDGKLYLKGPEPGGLKGIDVDMSDFSDQVLTLAAIAPYANSPVHIRNVGHIRGQECDRLHAIRVNMEKMDVPCKEESDGIYIEPSEPRPALIDTFHDHRVAMAFAVTGVCAKGITITDPWCCKKTFADFFDVLDQVYEQNPGCSADTVDYPIDL